MGHNRATENARSQNPWMLASAPRHVDGLAELSTRDELAAFLSVSVPTLARWATTGEGPRVTKIGAHVRYRRAHVLEYLDTAAR